MTAAASNTSAPLRAASPMSIAEARVSRDVTKGGAEVCGTVAAIELPLPLAPSSSSDDELLGMAGATRCANERVRGACRLAGLLGA